MNCRSSLFLTIFGVLAADIGLALLPSFAHYPNLSIAFHSIALFLTYRYCFRYSPIRHTALLVITGIALRLIFLGYPLSDDVNRYAWEGKIQSSGLNPYTTSPQSVEDLFTDDPIYSSINHKDVSAIYPPLTMLIFRALSAINYSLTTYKIFFIFCDILILLLLPLLIRQWAVPSHRLALYAWNPLILIVISGSGHLDVLQILFIVVAFIAYTRKPESSLLMSISFLFLGFATMTKWLAVLLLPFFVTRRNIVFLLFFFLPFLCFIPFFDADMSSGLMKFSGEMAYNDLIPKLIRVLVTPKYYKVVMLLVFAMGYFIIWLFNDESHWRGMLFAWLWCLFCLPCVHTWYLAPIALFIIKFPHRPSWLFLMTSAFAFHVSYYQLQTGEWREFFWIWLATYLPVLFMIFYDWNRSELPWITQHPVSSSIDVVIPTCNEAKTIDAHLQSVQTAIARLPAKYDFRIIVVDGQSTDDTYERVSRTRCHLLRSKRGRGNQISAALADSNGDLVVILHADSTVDELTFERLLETLERKPSVGWGILGHHYGSDNRAMSLIRILNTLRFHLFAIAFGDQGIFFRRKLLEQQGGLPAIPLMEDVELSMRLSPFPRTKIGEFLTLSTRRWSNQSATKHAFLVIGIVFYFLIARRLGCNITKQLYQIYYGQNLSTI